MSICTESTRGLREPVLQVLVAARVFLGQRVNLQEKYDYPEIDAANACSSVRRLRVMNVSFEVIPFADSSSVCELFSEFRMLEGATLLTHHQAISS